MRRIALILALICAVPVVLAAAAVGDDKRTYQAEFFNAFGVVEGSELRVAGVKAGTITGLDVTPEKTALISFEVGPEFPELKADATCSSEPQSLIAEYFVDCQPGSSDEPLEGPIPAARNQTTVQNDLVQNTLREPYKRRLQLIINEFGTALVGNPENLNAAIRAGAPALRELRKVLTILGRQNQLIAQLNADSDVIFQQLTDRREDVVRFIDEAEDTARISVERRADLSRDFDLLDDFLFELRPVMVQLGNLAREQTPLLIDLNAAAPGLNRLATNLPRFNNATRISLKSLGRASDVGRRALGKAEDEIAQLETTSEKAFPAADSVATFLESLDDPRRASEEDARATYDLRELPGEANSRIAELNDRVGGGVTEAGYTGLEGLLNYVYYQTLALNQFDQVGHLLHFILLEVESSPCAGFNAGPTYPNGSTNPVAADRCAALLGDQQPGINVPVPLRRYNGVGANSVCPDGSAVPALCTPGLGPTSARAAGLTAAGGQRSEPAPLPPPDKVEDIIDKIERGKLPPAKERRLREILGLPPDVKLPPGLEDGLGLSQTDSAAANDLLGFLIGP
jgi:ABC-type transporter Mla subunit MlaD